MKVYHTTKTLDFAKQIMQRGTDASLNTEKMGGGFYVWTTLGGAKGYAKDPNFQDRGGDDPHILEFEAAADPGLFEVDYEVSWRALAEWTVDHIKEIEDRGDCVAKLTPRPGYPGGMFPMFYLNKPGSFKSVSLGGHESPARLVQGPKATNVTSAALEDFYRFVKKIGLEADMEAWVFDRAAKGDNIALKYVGPPLKPVALYDATGKKMDLGLLGEAALRAYVRSVLRAR